MSGLQISGILLVAQVILLTVSHLAADTREAAAVRVSEIPRIDGRLNEEMWRRLPVLTDFVQYNPYNGDPGSQKTEVWIGYDDRAVYIGAVCHDSEPSKIKTTLSIRDQLPPGMNGDIFAVLFNPYNDGLNSVFFYVTAAGVQRDVMIHGDQHDTSWDAVWESAVTMSSSGWTVEIKIPLSALRFSTRRIQDWGLNLWRWIPRNREWDVWNHVEVTYPGWWKKNGLWRGIENLDPPLRLSFTPYVSGYLDFESGRETRFLYNGGLDIKYGISSGFTLDATLIPDFGQVQSDDIELNLSPYEIKYNEKRQFFTEGTELFTKGDLFYSRRIGDKPPDYETVYDEISDDEMVLKNPREARLINATKFSGRTNSGLGIGMLNAMTANTYATVLNETTGKERKILTQPFTNHNMVVLDQTLFAHSYISLVNSNVSREGHHANVTALDFNLADKSNTFGLNGIFGYSLVRCAQQDTSGYKLLVTGGKIGGDLKVRYNLSLVSDEYDQNDFGYLRRNNEVVNRVDFSHQITRPFGIFLSLRNSLELIHGRSFNPGDFSEFIYSYDLYAQFKNYIEVGLRFEHAPVDRRDYHEPRVDGRYFVNYKYFKYNLSGTTDLRKPVWIDLNGEYCHSYDYDFDVSSLILAISPHFTLSDHLVLGLENSYERWRNQPGYVDQDSEDGMVYFGRRNRNTVANSLVLSYLFNHEISLTFRLRHYHSRAVYDSFFELRSDGTLEPTDYSGDHDINYNAFNIDCSLRWNFAPGSEILLNWKNAIYTSDQAIDDNYWQNFVSTIGRPQTNSISLKVIYYFEI